MAVRKRKMSVSTTAEELFRAEISEVGPGVYLGGRKELVTSPLSKTEAAAIRKVFVEGLKQIEKISPKIASDIRVQESLVYEIAQVFKGMLAEKKNYSFPSQAGTLGVNWLVPQFVKYVATPSSTSPAYTSYNNDSWDIPLTAGTAAYIFGDGTNYYKASSATGAHEMLLIFKDGLIEIGSTPKIEQFRIWSEGVQMYGIYTVSPLVDQPLESGKTIYQYPTPVGAIPVFYDKGIMWKILPKLSGTATLKLLGLAFYEHDFAADTKWVS